LRKKVLSVFGTRPEAIKMAPVVLALAADPRFESRVCVTAQHRQMLDPVLELFGITPDRDLDVMRPGQDLFDVTSRVLLAMRDVLREERPDLVLVQGDTTTCFAAALAAFYENVPVGHVEAGLRTGNLRAPFPEEANRAMVSRIASLHFAPTEWARQNLLREGIPDAAIHVTGNTVIDALLMVRDKVLAADPARWRAAVRRRPARAHHRPRAAHDPRHRPPARELRPGLRGPVHRDPRPRPAHRTGTSCTPCTSTRTCRSPCSRSWAGSPTWR
jgi:UDP-N-acetylglucosamine 2-epimerase (non-hydrolysing)